MRSACSFDLRRAHALLAADPQLAAHDVATAAVSGDAESIDARDRARPGRRHPGLRAARAPSRSSTPASRAWAAATPSERAGIRAVVAALLDAGADPNASFDNDDGWLQVPLYGAAGIANDAELTRMLIGAGADPNDAREPFTVGEALYHACEFDDPTCARLLIEAGTDLEVVEHCLGRALNFPNHEMVAMFCAAGARPRGRHLHQALWRRRPAATVAVLLDAGAPIEERDENGLTPLQIATRWGQRETVELLLARGADPAAITAQDRAIGAILDGAGAAAPPEVLADMLDLAVQGGDSHAVGVLLRAGADPDGRPRDEHTPLGQAAWRGHAAVVSELLAGGASLTWAEGSPIGAALHGSRHCHDPEGGPTMRTAEEVPKDRYAAVVAVLLAAGASVPARLGEDGPSTTTHPGRARHRATRLRTPAPSRHRRGRRAAPTPKRRRTCLRAQASGMIALASKSLPEESSMASATTTTIPAGTYVTDPAHTSFGFSVKHLGIATVRGKFNEFEGTLEIGEDPASARIWGTAKAASIDTGEPARDAHLRSADFFDAETYPELRFESTRPAPARRGELRDRGQPHDARRERPADAERGVPRHRGRPLRQRPRRLRDHRQAVALGLGHEVQRRPRQRQRRRLRHRQDHDRRLGDPAGRLSERPQRRRR